MGKGKGDRRSDGKKRRRNGWWGEEWNGNWGRGRGKRQARIVEGKKGSEKDGEKERGTRNWKEEKE